jgi:hypothetical protein
MLYYVCRGEARYALYGWNVISNIILFSFMFQRVNEPATLIYSNLLRPQHVSLNFGATLNHVCFQIHIPTLKHALSTRNYTYPISLQLF